jgi:hypothetical protein
VQSAYVAAEVITKAGTPDDAMAAIRNIEAGVDSHTDPEHTFQFNQAERLVDLLAAEVAQLQRAADALVAQLAQLAAQEAELVSGTVAHPKPIEFGHPVVSEVR